MPQSEQKRTTMSDAHSGRTRQSATRVDTAHFTAGEAAVPEASPTAPAASESVLHPAELAAEVTVQQIRSQASQLAAHLQRQQAAVDHRESELNSRLAAMENQIRSARLWLNERQAELDRREAELATIATQREGEMTASNERREVEVAAMAKRLAEQVVTPEQVLEVQQSLRMIEVRRESLEQAEKLLSSDQTEVERQRQQLAQQRAELAHAARADKQKLAEDQQRATAEHERLRQELKRQSDELAARQAALERMKADVGRAQQESLEIRLATEELWARLCGTMAPAALTHSLAQIRLKLAEDHRLARSELAQQKTDVQALSARLGEQHQKLARERDEFQTWARERQKELEEQAASLVAQQQRVEEQLAESNEQTRQWQSERFRLQQEIRRLLRLVNRPETVAA
jgi:hypothetical protein